MLSRWLTAVAVALLFVSAALAAPPAHIVVTLLGTGNPRPDDRRFGPAILVEADEERILIDAGRGATIRLFSIGRAPLLSGITAVLLTHLHSDHTVGLPDLWLTGWIFGRREPLAVYGPAGTRTLTEHLTQAYAFDVHMRRDVDERLPATGADFDAHDVTPGVVFARHGVTVTAFAVDHGPVTPAYGYRIEHGGRVVVFSGDTRYSAAVAAAARGADLLVHEVLSPEVERRLSAMRDPAQIERVIAHHTTPEEAGRLFADAKPRLAVYSHIVPSPARPADLVPPTRRAYKGPLVVGTDLMRIDVGPRIVISQRR
ncbi:MAG: MBL fold metallo-hydrolase [Acidobacteria bacterium]|nr:MAG: MBL fold metallo-hydrolase [Acidobacteriota bacterium]